MLRRFGFGWAKGMGFALPALAEAKASAGTATSSCQLENSKLVAQVRQVIAVYPAYHPGQFILGADPYLYEHVVVGKCHHVGRRSADDLGLADVKGQDQPIGQSLVRVGYHHVR